MEKLTSEQKTLAKQLTTLQKKKVQSNEGPLTREQKAEIRRIKKLEKISQLIERDVREDVIRLRLCCTVSDIHEARKLVNKKATPETLTKSNLDTLTILESRGTLDQYHLFAAEEIHLAHDLGAQDVACKIASLKERVDIIGHQFSETESELHVRLQNQYRSWFINCRHSGVDFNACLYMILNHVTLEEADRHFGKRNGYVKMHLVWGLGRYCSLFRPIGRNK